MSEKKGHVFQGFFSGANYDWLASLIGFGPALYRQAARAIPLRSGMRVLDLGCGTASFGLVIAERIGDGSQIHALDLSQDQLSHARRKANQLEVPFEFHQGSMDELPFEPATFDAVVSSMALHEVPPAVRRGAIRETARVLKPEGIFALVDWSKPRFGLMTIFWLPFLLFDSSRDNWDNIYPALCREQNLLLTTDVYLNSLVRCQVFRKA
jgi:ubiquinone/menaquinone biosynthesis C-methylase UbiE